MSASIQDVHAFLKGKTFYPATISASGKPRVRPFGAVALHNGKVCICTGSKKQVSAELKAGFVEISATAENGDWIRLESKASLDTTTQAKDQMFAENPRLADIYKGREDEFEVFSLQNGKAVLLDIAGNVKWSVVL